MYLVYVCFLIVAVTAHTLEDLPGESNEDLNALNVAQLKHINQIRDVLYNKARRKALRIFLAKSKLFNEGDQLGVWELCERYMYYFSDAPEEEEKKYFQSIVDHILDRRSGSCKPHLKIPRIICAEFKKEGPDYFERVTMLQDTVANYLQRHIFRDFKEYICKELMPDYNSDNSYVKRDNQYK